MKSNSQAAHLGFVLFAKNLSTVSKFYQLSLKLDLVEKTASHHLLQGRGIELVIHAIPKKHASTIQLSNPPEPRNTGAIKPAFFIDDLAALRTVIENNGGYLKPDKAAWDIRGAKVLDGWDPEGNIVQFKQLLTS